MSDCEDIICSDHDSVRGPQSSARFCRILFQKTVSGRFISRERKYSTFMFDVTGNQAALSAEITDVIGKEKISFTMADLSDSEAELMAFTRTVGNSPSELLLWYMI